MSVGDSVRSKEMKVWNNEEAFDHSRSRDEVTYFQDLETSQELARLAQI